MHTDSLSLLLCPNFRGRNFGVAIEIWPRTLGEKNHRLNLYLIDNTLYFVFWFILFLEMGISDLTAQNKATI